MAVAAFKAGGPRSCAATTHPGLCPGPRQDGACRPPSRHTPAACAARGKGSPCTRSPAAARAQSCLTRAGHRPVVWPHEIPDSGISHRNTGSSPRSGTEAGDISPVFAALEHAAGDFTTLGKNPLLECSSPSDTYFPHIRLFPGMQDRHPGACCCQRRAIGVPSFLFLPDQGFAAGLACSHGDGLGSLSGARLQRGCGRVPGEGNLVLA